MIDDKWEDAKWQSIRSEMCRGRKEVKTTTTVRMRIRIKYERNRRY